MQLKSYPTMATLLAAPVPSDGQVVVVRPLGTVGDGVKRFFYYDGDDTTTPDNVTVYQRTALGVGRWIRLS